MNENLCACARSVFDVHLFGPQKKRAVVLVMKPPGQPVTPSLNPPRVISIVQLIALPLYALCVLGFIR